MLHAQASEAKYKVVVERDAPMRTRDGVTLRADIYRPLALDENFPVLLARTPYDKSVELALTEKDYFAPRGYIVVVQDTRGRFSSQGEFAPFFHEAADGYDAIEWAASIPGANGVVATVGQSYMGLTQYLAAAERPPHLRAATPVSGPVSYFENCIYRRGVFELGWMLTYFTFMARNTLDRRGILKEQGPILDGYLSKPSVPFSPMSLEAYKHLPIRDWGERLRPGAPYFAEYLGHSRYDGYWQGADVRRRFEQVAIPMLHVGSWYDAFQYDTLAMFTGLRERAATSGAQRGQRLIMGPWGHLLPYAVPTSKGTGDIDFGPEAMVELHAIQARWFDWVLKGIANGAEQDAPVRIFVMGENRWRDENEWPLARTRYTPIYLHSAGSANGSGGDGRLGYSKPGEEPADTYLYDPSDPVPTRGGTTLGLPLGVFDQRQIEERADVLVFTGERIESATEVTGPIVLKLFAASSACDTDFTAKLVDVRPDGYAQNIAEGVVRARFRESLSEPSLITPDRRYEYTIDLWSTSHVFKEGHRIRLEVSSSNFPRYDRNQNTGHEFGADRELVTARQTIFHDDRCPSHLVLPIIPR